MSYSEEFFDEEARFPEHWQGRDIIAIEQFYRLSATVQAAEMSLNMSRRLGGDATREELAADKRSARRVAHYCRQFAGAWLTEVPDTAIPPVPKNHRMHKSIRKLASVVEWDAFADALESELLDQCRLIVSWAYENDDKKFANRAASRLLKEIDRMKEITR